MEVYKVGTEVTTKIGNFKGMITEIKITGYEDITYNVTYIDEGIKNMFFYDFELIIGTTEKQVIGFKI